MSQHPGAQRSRKRDAAGAGGRHEARGRRHPGLGRRSRQAASTASLGWRLDADFAVGDDFRVVQFTPPGSRVLDPVRHRTSRRPRPARPRACTWSSPTSRRRATSSSAAASTVSEVFHDGTPGARFQPDGTSGRVSGPAPGTRSYALVRLVQRSGRQRLAAPGDHRATARTRGRATSTTFTSAADLASALRRAAAAHGEHEKRIGAARRGLAGLVRRRTWSRSRPARPLPT